MHHEPTVVPAASASRSRLGSGTSRWPLLAVDQAPWADRSTLETVGNLDDLATRALVATDADLAINAGCDLSDAGRHAEAEACFRRAVALGDERAWFHVGNELREQGQPADAVEAFERAIAAGEVDALRNKAQLVEELGDLDSAISLYTRAGEAGDAAGFHDLAGLLREQGRHEEAEVALQRFEDMRQAHDTRTPASDD